MVPYPNTNVTVVSSLYVPSLFYILSRGMVESEVSINNNGHTSYGVYALLVPFTVPFF